MKPIVNVYRLGRVPYIKALGIQNVLFENLKRVVTSPGHLNHADFTDNNGRGEDGIRRRIKSILHCEQAGLFSTGVSDLHVTNSLVLVEHEPVYTVGLRAQQYNQDYVAKLKARLHENNLHADFVKTNRGGLITFHGPGQFVAYPVIYLGDFHKTVPNKSVKSYVKKLEDTIIGTLANVGVEGAHTVVKYPGVWLANGDRKIAFVGITCKRYVTMHGISINCDCDLSWFDHIVSCGIEDKMITSVYHELQSIRRSDVHRNEHFGYSGSSKDDLSQYNINPSQDLDAWNSGPGYGLQNIANAFCSSFSHHFDCALHEG